MVCGAVIFSFEDCDRVAREMSNCKMIVNGEREEENSR